MYRRVGLTNLNTMIIFAQVKEKPITLFDTARYRRWNRTRHPMYTISQAEMERIDILTILIFIQERMIINNGVTSEFSRGCTAKCTFCEETHFWKYRQRLAVDVVREAEYLYYEKGADVMWFIDSLINDTFQRT